MALIRNPKSAVRSLKALHYSLTLGSSSRRQLLDITTQVTQLVQKGGLTEGICTISAQHATAAILVNENESGLADDILHKIEDLFPAGGRYAHNRIDDNADAHLAASFIGHSKTFPIIDGNLARGTWQNIFLVELDGPRRSRTVHVQMIGEE
jgi:secondary thiamine-phosphate synthase enzyme